jgi:glycosyltransferase involved in cell wall biosynthesis
LIWISILLTSSIVSIVYYSFFYYEFLKYKNLRNGVEQGISVVIAAHNELGNLEKLIPAIKNQSHSDFEIIVANDRSTDGTETFLKSQKIKYLNILQTPLNKSPKKHALASAILMAQKPVIVLTDADCVPVSNDWLKGMLEGFLPDVEIVLGYSPYKRTSGLLNFLIRFDTFQGAMLFFSSTLSGNAYMGVGRNIAYKKALFEKIGFEKHIHVAGGDDDLFVRDSSNGRNVGIKLEKNAQTVSIPKTTYKQWFSQKRRHQTAGIYYNILDKIYLGCFQLATVLFYISSFFAFFLDKHTLLVVIIFILRTLGLVLIQKFVSVKLDDRFAWFMVPLLDFVCVWINTIVGITVLIRKKVTWK